MSIHTDIVSTDFRSATLLSCSANEVCTKSIILRIISKRGHSQYESIYAVDALHNLSSSVS
ncbi:MAG: hypothetical protein P9L91_02390, partial [Candidatus Zophobacter franzmannii]|nr:hypothetical protein [Candidatus Zophobacter franzmannii]